MRTGQHVEPIRCVVLKRREQGIGYAEGADGMTHQEATLLKPEHIG